jgi:hypothetical protein
MGYLRGYANITDEPNEKLCVENPHKVYASLDSGEFMYVHKELIRVYMPREELHDLIEAHREMYPTYQDMLKALKIE